MIYTIRKIIDLLSTFWEERNCKPIQQYMLPVGAATFHPIPFVSLLKSDQKNYCFAQVCDRPLDYIHQTSSCTNRFGQYFQFQVIIQKPADDILDHFMQSLSLIGIQPEEHDIRFIRDNWESASLGAHGIGWEVRVNGIEIAQITYMNRMGGMTLPQMNIEITYGVERAALIAQKLSSAELVPNLAYDEHTTYIEFTGSFTHKTVPTESYENYKDLYEMHHTIAKFTDDFYAKYDHAVMMSHLTNLIDAIIPLQYNEKCKYISETAEIFNSLARTLLPISTAFPFDLPQNKYALEPTETSRIELSDGEKIIDPTLKRAFSEYLECELDDNAAIVKVCKTSPSIENWYALSIFFKLEYSLKTIIWNSNNINRIMRCLDNSIELSLHKSIAYIFQAYADARRKIAFFKMSRCMRDENNPSINILSLTRSMEKLVQHGDHNLKHEDIALVFIRQEYPTHLSLYTKREEAYWESIISFAYIIRVWEQGGAPTSYGDKYRVKQHLHKLIKSTIDLELQFPLYETIIQALPDNNSARSIAEEICEYVYSQYALFDWTAEQYKMFKMNRDVYVDKGFSMFDFYNLKKIIRNIVDTPEFKQTYKRISHICKKHPIPESAKHNSFVYPATLGDNVKKKDSPEAVLFECLYYLYGTQHVQVESLPFDHPITVKLFKKTPEQLSQLLDTVFIDQLDDESPIKQQFVIALHKYKDFVDKYVQL